MLRFAKKSKFQFETFNADPSKYRFFSSPSIVLTDVVKYTYNEIKI